MDERLAVLERGPWMADPYLRPSRIVDWTAPEVVRLARELGSDADDSVEIARRCFEWVRDRVEHTADAGREEVTCRASDVLREGTGLCYAKSHLLVALLRANGLRAGFVYQRLTQDGESQAFCLHGLAAVDLPGYGWYRVDPRGNRPGVHAQFTPPVERLAYPGFGVGEVIFPEIYAEPVGPVVRALELRRSAAVLLRCLPDAVTVQELTR